MKVTGLTLFAQACNLPSIVSVITGGNQEMVESTGSEAKP